jgi:prepilin-type N-terminal cleavage/methylation domain-containing protein
MRNRIGLTLIELLIVVIILGALAAIAIPRITTSSTTAKKNACITNVDTLNTAMEMYKMDHSSTAYPTLAVLTADPNYFPDGTPVCPFSDGTTFPYVLKGDGSNRVQTHTH